MAAKDITQEKLSKKAGVPRPTINQWIMGEQTPDIGKKELGEL